MATSAIKASFQKYPSYKDSGEYWMGLIPNHWEIKKLKHVFQEKKKVTNPQLPCGSISYGKVVYKDDEKIPESTKASYQEVLSGEFLINPLNLNYDLVSLRIGLSQINVVVSSGYIVLKETIKLDKSYFNYLLHRFDVAYMKLLGSGVRQTINFNHISNSQLAFPPLPEQTAIAKFLDDKTAKIDRAIAQKEKMIALLKERKQIIIQNAVTKGLDPNAKMKDSGVEWIGEIPEGWEVKKVKHFGTIKSGESVVNSLLMDSGIYEVYGGNGNMGYYNKFNVDGERIIIGRVGAYCGNVRYTNEKKWISDNALILTLNNIKLYRYFTILLESGNLNTLNSSNAQPLITGTKVLNFPIPFPPISIQPIIVKHIETQSTKIDKAIKLQEQQIEKLKELKSTLIDSAVTGKIKVSEL